MLGQKSPKAANEKEKRVSMGGSVSNTPFGPLVSLLSHLVRSMHTSQMLESPKEVILSTHVLFSDEQDTKAPKQILAKKIQISQEAIDFLTNKDLFNIVIEHNYQEEVFGLALAHLCFDNRKLSK